MPESSLPAPPAELPGLLTYEQVGQMLGGVSVRQVARYVAARRLKVADLGHRTKRFRRADVERFIAKRAGDRSPEYL